MEMADFTSKIWRIISSKENTTDWSLHRSGNRYFLNWSEKRAPAKNAFVCQFEQNLKIGRPSLWKNQNKAVKRKYKSPSQMRRDRMRWEAYFNKNTADGQEIPTTALTIGEIFPFEDLEYHSSKNRERLSLGEIFPFEDLDTFCESQSFDEEQFSTPPSTPKKNTTEKKTDSDKCGKDWIKSCYIQQTCPSCNNCTKYDPNFYEPESKLPDKIVEKLSCCSIREDFDKKLISYFLDTIKRKFNLKNDHEGDPKAFSMTCCKCRQRVEVHFVVRVNE